MHIPQSLTTHLRLAGEKCTTRREKARVRNNPKQSRTALNKINKAKKINLLGIKEQQLKKRSY